MTERFDIGSAWLRRQRRSHATRSVTYTRGATSVSLLASVGMTEFQSTDESGVILQHETRDYLVDAADLILSGASTEPRAGDRITDGSVTYEVVCPVGSVPWAWHDRNRLTYRIHTVQQC